MEPHSRQQLGAAAEQSALSAARRRGWRCLARNYRTRGGELDLVLVDGDTLVVTEVRYRNTGRYGGGIASVDRRKQARIVRATRHFLASHPRWTDAPVRFDVVGVDEAGRLEWIEDAFYVE
ncbi:MAG: YraN family protein [Salinisphaera sp.]|nr:YraN family protein [Salinisphaera sp.]